MSATKLTHELRENEIKQRVILIFIAWMFKPNK